jgi:hypothetical protein
MPCRFVQVRPRHNCHSRLQWCIVLFKATLVTTQCIALTALSVLHSLPLPCNAHVLQPKEIGLPFTAYTAIDEVREVSSSSTCSWGHRQQVQSSRDATLSSAGAVQAPSGGANVSTSSPCRAQYHTPLCIVALRQLPTCTRQPATGAALAGAHGNWELTAHSHQCACALCRAVLCCAVLCCAGRH